MQDAKNLILNQNEPIQIMNTKIKVYTIEWNWSVDPYDEPSFSRVTVGADPYEVWGDDPDEWTEEQVGWDQTIWHFFEDMDELKSYCVNDGKGEWYIKSHEFDHELDLATLK